MDIEICLYLHDKKIRKLTFMKIKSKLTKIFYTFSLLALITSQQINTKTDNQVQAIPLDSIAQAQGTNISFEVCVDHANFVRPNPQKHVNRLRSDNHYQDMSSQEIWLSCLSCDKQNLWLSKRSLDKAFRAYLPKKLSRIPTFSHKVQESQKF